MQGLIIAAGRGSRLAGRPQSKPLLPVGGRPLVDWVLLAGLEAGLREFVVVTGYARETLERHLEGFGRENRVSIACVANDEWEKENGLSVHKARERLHGAFVLMMSDHIVEPRLVERIAGQRLGADEIMLAVDLRLSDHPTADLDDVTKVLVRDGLIEGIGKMIGTYNAFDTGVFLCSPGIFPALEESQRRGDFSLSGGIRVLMEARRARAVDIGDAFWIDVDDEGAVGRAERLLAARPAPLLAGPALPGSGGR
ncbi:MAG TPA: NTP transferase domain-containing protein [Terriglobales bacterium]|nr:NTP transferase domain-containing protein [Terriglobales bacterium]